MCKISPVVEQDGQPLPCISSLATHVCDLLNSTHGILSNWLRGDSKQPSSKLLANATVKQLASNTPTDPHKETRSSTRKGSRSNRGEVSFERGEFTRDSSSHVVTSFFPAFLHTIAVR